MRKFDWKKSMVVKWIDVLNPYIGLIMNLDNHMHA
jgi:hypothetical protein